MVSGGERRGETNRQTLHSFVQQQICAKHLLRAAPEYLEPTIRWTGLPRSGVGGGGPLRWSRVQGNARPDFARARAGQRDAVKTSGAF